MGSRARRFDLPPTTHREPTSNGTNDLANASSKPSMSSSPPPACNPALQCIRSAASNVIDSFSATTNELDATELQSLERGCAKVEKDENCENSCDKKAVKPESWSCQLGRFWRREFSVVVPGNAARDHLALERTFLSYHRMSILLAILSVTIAQLQVLNHSPKASDSFGYYILGKPLAATVAVLAITTETVGAIRWWRWQNTMLRGKGVSGGWEMAAVGVIAAALAGLLFGLSLAVDIKRTYF